MLLDSNSQEQLALPAQPTPSQLEELPHVQPVLDVLHAMLLLVFVPLVLLDQDCNLTEVVLPVHLELSLTEPPFVNPVLTAPLVLLLPEYVQLVALVSNLPLEPVTPVLLTLSQLEEPTNVPLVLPVLLAQQQMETV